MDSVKMTDREVAEQIGKLNEGRAKTYALLSRLFRAEVDRELLDAMRGMRFPADTGNEKMDEGHRLIVGQLSTVWENTLSELAIDYARVFLGGGIDGHSAAYPFESVYTSPRRLLMQDARDEVVALYRSEGIDKAEGWTEGEDHVSLELEFMGRLAERAHDALTSEGVDGAPSQEGMDEAFRLMQVQRAFMEDHLCAWVPMLTSEMLRFARTRLYRGLAFVTEGFLETDRDFLAGILGPE